MAKLNAMSRPCEKAGAISDGKKLRPVRYATWLAGRLLREWPSRVCTGL